MTEQCGDAVVLAEAVSDCEDCPPGGYPNDITRCLPCPRRAPAVDTEAAKVGADEAGRTDLDALEALLAEATPGPFDRHSTDLVRAIRGDLAVPLFEPRSPLGDPDMPAPTVRDGRRVIFKAGSFDAKFSAAMKREAANVRLVVALLNSAPAIISELRALRARARSNPTGRVPGAMD